VIGFAEMTKHECRMTNVEKFEARGIRSSRFVTDSSSIIRPPGRSRAKAGHSSFSAKSAFTLIEMVVVLGLILVLTGLVLSTVGYARKKGARARAETEIAAMSAACENYKADNGIYPRDASSTDLLDARGSGDPSAYQSASLSLYNVLFGATAGSRTNTGARSYFVFRPNMLFPADQTQPVLYIQDPFGNSYGYSTIQAATSNTTKGYNPTFDLWSTAGLTTNPPSSGTDTITPQWIKNW
jgi:prepilin-type N-terminal cleavage/methylation domain-containing protein